MTQIPAPSQPLKALPPSQSCGQPMTAERSSWTGSSPCPSRATIRHLQLINTGSDRRSQLQPPPARPHPQDCLSPVGWTAEELGSILKPYSIFPHEIYL